VIYFVKVLEQITLTPLFLDPFISELVVLGQPLHANRTAVYTLGFFSLGDLCGGECVELFSSGDFERRYALARITPILGGSAATCFLYFGTHIAKLQH